MKITFTLIILLQINLLFAQDSSIIAGVYDSSMIYYNYDPDTVLPYGTTHIYSSSLNIDLNFDSIVDYEIYCLNATGQGVSNYIVTITPHNNNEVNYYRIDTIYYQLWDSTIYYHIPKPFRYGEEINSSYHYTSDGLHLYRDSWSPEFSHEIFDWDNIGDGYLGIRMNINDTMFYGWIRLDISTGVNNGGASQVTIMEYALSKPTISGIFDSDYGQTIKVYPNPVETDLNIFLPENFNSWNISILDINGATCKSNFFLNSGLKTLNISDLESGSYILRIVADNNIYYSKIIKQ